MARPLTSPRPVPIPVSDPSLEEIVALRLVEGYFTRAGTQVASRLLDCPELNHEAALAAALGNALRRGAALCAGLREHADAHDPPRRW